MGQNDQSTRAYTLLPRIAHRGYRMLRTSASENALRCRHGHQLARIRPTAVPDGDEVAAIGRKPYAQVRSASGKEARG